MVNRELLLVIERWIVIPLIGTLIMHGLVDQKDLGLWVNVLDQIFGGAFIIIAYLVTHRKTKTTTTEEVSAPYEIKLWEKLKPYLFVQKTVTTTEVPQQ